MQIARTHNGYHLGKNRADYFRAYARAEYAKNPEKYRARCRESYHRNKEARLAKAKEYRDANRDRLKANSKKYYQAHKERISNLRNSPKYKSYFKEYATKYRKTIRGSAIRREQKLRRRSVNEPLDSKSIVEWSIKWKSKTLTKCYWCGNQTPTKRCHIDHITPLSKGGLHSVSNLCVSCPRCNKTKAARLLPEWNGMLREPVLL